jgi:hypothetical protein
MHYCSPQGWADATARKLPLTPTFGHVKTAFSPVDDDDQCGVCLPPALGDLLFGKSPLPAFNQEFEFDLIRH